MQKPQRPCSNTAEGQDACHIRHNAADKSLRSCQKESMLQFTYVSFNQSLGKIRHCHP